MGKRKRRAQRPPIASLSPPDAIPCSSGLNQLVTERSSAQISTRGEKPQSPAKDIMGSDEQKSAQVSQSHHHHHHNHQNPGRPMHMKRSRHRGHHHPRHNQSYQYSTSHGKNNSFFDHQTGFKGGHRWNSESGYTTEYREKSSSKPDRIRASNTVMEVEPWDDNDKMVCDTCARLLRQRQVLSSSLLANEPCVVSVLVCGHIFHADCLEQKTRAEDASDPPCPLCSEPPLKTGAG